MYVNPRESTPWLEQLPSASNNGGSSGECPWLGRYLAEAGWKRLNFRRVVARLQQLGLSGVHGTPKVLDFGCSIGLFLQVAAEAGWDAYGVETDTAVASYGKDVLGLRIFNGLLADAEFPVDCFDAVVSFQVFEHLPDPGDELRQIWRVLRRGGWLAVDVPSIDTMWYWLLRGRHRHFATPQHIYFYTPATMSKLLRKTGFEVQAVDFPSRSLSLEHVCRHHVALYSQKLSDYLAACRREKTSPQARSMID